MDSVRNLQVSTISEYCVKCNTIIDSVEYPTSTVPVWDVQAPREEPAAGRYVCVTCNIIVWHRLQTVKGSV